MEIVCSQPTVGSTWFSSEFIWLIERSALQQGLLSGDADVVPQFKTISYNQTFMLNNKQKKIIKKTSDLTRE